MKKGTRDKLLKLIPVLSVVGTAIMVFAGLWDVNVHLTDKKDYFWSTPHVVVYHGVGMTGIAALISLFLFVRNVDREKIKKICVLLVVGSVMQMAGGLWDFRSHEIYGIDGFVSPSHSILESGLVMVALGALLSTRLLPDGIRKYFIAAGAFVLVTVSFFLFLSFMAYFFPFLTCLQVNSVYLSGCSVM